MISIQPQYLSLTKLLDSRLFRIPEYQRAYSWTSKERNDLFSDIEKTFQKGEGGSHFLAAVVCLRREKQEFGTDEYQIVEVVDGQQRLTTIIILMKSVVINLNVKKKDEKKLHDELSDLLVKQDGDELLLLQTNHDSSHYFSNFIREGNFEKSTVAKSIADREILGAIEDCNKFVKDWMDSGRSLIGLLSLLKNRLFILLHEIEDEQAVYTVFEVLNSRGLDVSWMDRLKSILMGIAFELKPSTRDRLINELHTIWRDIYKTIGLRQGMSTESLRFSATLYSKSIVSKPLGEEDAVSVFRDSASDAKSIRLAAQWILKVTNACDFIHSKTRINAVTRIAQARLLAVSIVLRDDLTEKQKEDLLAQWEKVSFRIYGMLGYDARTSVGEYVRLSWKIVHEKPNFISIMKSIKEIGVDYPILDSVNALSNTNCYEGWETELRYLMYRYEEYLSANEKLQFSNENWEKIWLASPSDSIEHIFPKSKAPVKQMHRLGNLVLLPPRLNSKLQAKMPAEKVASYRKTGLLIAIETADAIEKATKWDKKAIDAREEKILKWAMKEWGD